MKKHLILIISILIIVISTNNNLKAQFSSDVDGVIHVNDMNGSLNYIYPISSNSIDGYPIKVNLNYVDNVLFTSIDQGYPVDEQNHIAFSFETKTNPAWIVGVNQFAIQVLGHRGFYSRYKDPIFSLYNYEWIQGYYSEQQAWLIDGYDYCNQLKRSTKEG